MQHKLTRPEHEWRSRLVTQAAALDGVLASVHRIAVVGIKPEEVGGWVDKEKEEVSMGFGACG